jgi:hypothetical protein
VATGATTPSNEQIVANQVRLTAGPAETLVVDLFWDGSVDPPPVFSDNRCHSSDRPGLCDGARSEN